MPSPTKDKINVSVFMDRDMAKALRLAAAKEGRLVSPVIRELVDRYLKETNVSKAAR